MHSMPSRVMSLKHDALETALGDQNTRINMEKMIVPEMKALCCTGEGTDKSCNGALLKSING